MARPLRVTPPGLVYHVYNRAVEDVRLFDDAADFDAFLDILAHAVDRFRVRVFDFVLMPNHWHLQCTPLQHGELSRFIKWMSETHAKRWRLHRRTVGRGHVYQSRFQAVAVQGDEHFLVLAAYIDRNPVRAGLVSHAADWRWGGLGVSSRPDVALRRRLHPWPVARPADWARIVELEEPSDRLRAVRESLHGGFPLGTDQWRERIARQTGQLGRLQRHRRRA